MNLTTCYCRNRYCTCYGLTRPQARLIRAGWHRRAPQLECVDCRHRFSARAGTAYAGIRSSDQIFRDGVRQLAEGASIRATARNIECDKDTVAQWLPRVGRHCQRRLNYFLSDLYLTECQLDEL